MSAASPSTAAASKGAGEGDDCSRVTANRAQEASRARRSSVSNKSQFAAHADCPSGAMSSCDARPSALTGAGAGDE